MTQYGALTRPEPQTLEDARRAVEATRARMSGTLDAIESQLIARKQELVDRIDVTRPIRRQIRRRPWPAIAVAFGAGVLLWRLRGNGHAREAEPQPPGIIRRWLQRG